MKRKIITISVHIILILIIFFLIIMVLEHPFMLGEKIGLLLSPPFMENTQNLFFRQSVKCTICSETFNNMLNFHHHTLLNCLSNKISFLLWIGDSLAMILTHILLLILSTLFIEIPYLLYYLIKKKRNKIVIEDKLEIE